MSRGAGRARTGKRDRGRPDTGPVAEAQRRASADVAASVDLDTARVVLAESNRPRRLRIQDVVRKHLSPLAEVGFQVRDGAVIEESDSLEDPWLAVVRLDSTRFDGFELVERVRGHCEFSFVVAYATSLWGEAEALEDFDRVFVVAQRELTAFLSTVCGLVAHVRLHLPRRLLRQRTSVLLRASGVSSLEPSASPAGRLERASLPTADAALADLARRALRVTGGNRSEAARLIGRNRKTLLTYLEHGVSHAEEVPSQDAVGSEEDKVRSE